MRAGYVAALKGKHVLDYAEFCAVMNVSGTTFWRMEQEMTPKEKPPFWRAGGRRMIQTNLALHWIDEFAKRNAWVKEEAMTNSEELELVRQMAAKLDCLVEDDFATLAGATASTVESWRKRGVGPVAVRLGTRYFYPAGRGQPAYQRLDRCSRIVGKGGAVMAHPDVKKGTHQCPSSTTHTEPLTWEILP